MSRFRPCIDLHDGKVKQIVGGTLGAAAGPATNFVAGHGAGYYAELYKRDNLSGGHVIMLGPGNEAAALEALTAYPGGLQLGGGVTSANAAKFLDAGAAKVIVTSWVFRDGAVNEANLAELVGIVGKERLVLDLSCRKRDGRYFIVTDRWQKFTTVEVNAQSLEKFAASCSEFLIHAVDVEGKQAGIDCELLATMAAGSPVAATYAGGIRNFDDIALIESCGGGRIDYTVGSALDLFGGPLSYREIAARGR